MSALLDSAFGFLVWAAHFLIVYISTAVSCVLGLGAAGTHMQTSVLASLAVLTILACIILASHAMRRHSQLRDNPEQEFRLAVTIGCDAIAMLLLVMSAALAACSLTVGWWWLRGLGIDPTAHAYGAAVWTLLGYMALHVLIGAGMALWCLLRLALGMIDSWRCLTLRICLLWWYLTTPAAVLALLLVAGFPHVIS